MEVIPFPDYDTFAKLAQEYNGPPIDMKYFSQRIANIGALGKEKSKPILEGICALMMKHAFSNGKTVHPSTPLYGGMACNGGYGIIFNSAPISPELLVIIYVYLETTSSTLKT